MSHHPPGQRLGWAAWRALAILLVLNTLYYTSRDVLAGVIGPVQQALDFQDDAVKAGTLSTIYFASQAVFSLLLGWLGDRLSRRYLIAGGVVIWGVATIASSLVHSFGQMLWTRIVLGTGEAAFGALAPGLLADLFPPERRSQAQAGLFLASPFGLALAYWLGGQVATHWGWRWAFASVGVASLLVAPGALLLTDPRQTRGSRQGRSDPGGLHASKRYVTLKGQAYIYATVGMALMTFGLAALIYWMPKLLSEVRGVPLQDATTVLAVVAFLSGLAGIPLGGWLGDRVAARRAGGRLWVCGLAVLVSVPCVLTIVLARRAEVIYTGAGLGLFLIFLTMGPATAVVADVTAPAIRGTAFGVSFLVIHLLGDIPAPVVVGWVADRTGSLPTGLALVLPALGIGGLLYCLGVRYVPAHRNIPTAPSTGHR